MNRVVFAAFALVVLATIIFPFPTSADIAGSSARGTFHVSLSEGRTTQIVFDAKTANDGSTTGEITFQDSLVEPSTSAAKIQKSDSSPLLSAKIQCDCLLVKGVEAALSGTIIESNNKNMIGSRVMLVVQDGDSLDPPLRDKLTFGFYKTANKSWVASDAERPDQQGPPASWVASDSERDDDPGVLSIKREEISCDTYPISSYSFINAKQGTGKIQVTR